MLKNVFIHAGDIATADSINLFCIRFQPSLEQAGFYALWFPDAQTSSSETTLAVANEIILSKPHIHTLLVMFSGYPSILEKHFHSFIASSKEIFQEATVHILWQHVPLDIALEHAINCSVRQGISHNNPLFFLFSHYLSCDDPDNSNIRSQHQAIWGTDLPINFVPCHPEDALPQWQEWVGLPQPLPRFSWEPLSCLLSTQFKSENRLLSPKVFAYIRAVHQRFNGTDVTPVYNWDWQEDFLAYEDHIPKNRKYCKEFLRKKLRAHSDKKSFVPWPLFDKEPVADLSDSPISLNAEDAQALSALLTQDFRKLVVQNIDQTTLQYKSQDERNAFGALLLVEKMIDEAAFKKLTALPQGACLPVPQANVIEVCDSLPTVAVLTMTYNQREFIEENILSIMAQKTKFPVTHIISDDASTDGTQEIIKEYAARYSHIHLLINEINDTPRSIINLFSQAKTPYVALCDGDDYFTDPLKLQMQVDLLEANPSYGLCFHPVALVYTEDPNKACIYPPINALPRGVRPYYYLLDLMRANLIQTNSVMYRWRFREGLPLWFNAHLCPSDRYWHFLHAESGKIGFQNRIMSVYRRHPDGLFIQTETDTVGHRKKCGIVEMQLYECLDLHFEGRFAEPLHKLGLNIFSELAQDAAKRSDPSYLFNFVEEFPIFKQYIKRVSAK